MPEFIIRDAASNVWEIAEMLGALQDVVYALRKRRTIVIDDDAIREIAKVVVRAAKGLPIPQVNGPAVDRRALALKATTLYLSDVRARADRQPLAARRGALMPGAPSSRKPAARWANRSR